MYMMSSGEVGKGACLPACLPAEQRCLPRIQKFECCILLNLASGSNVTRESFKNYVEKMRWVGGQKCIFLFMSRVKYVYVEEERWSKKDKILST